MDTCSVKNRSQIHTTHSLARARSFYFSERAITSLSINRHVKFDTSWKLIARPSADYFPVVIAAAS